LAIAAAVNRGQPAIAKALGLLELPADVQELIRTHRLTPSHGVALRKYAAFPAAASHIGAAAVEHEWTSKQLERGIPDFWGLAQAGLAARINRWEMDASACEDCPFGARVDDVCLNPAHYRELVQAKQKEAQKAIQRAQSAAKAKGEELLRLDKLPWDSCERIESFGSLPPGCSEACSCRAEALDRDGQKLVQICTDPNRLRKLRADETRAVNKVRRETGKHLAARVLEKLDVTTEAGVRELVLLVVAAARAVGNEAALKREALTRHAGELVPADKEGLQDWRIEERYPVLEALPADALVRLALEMLLRAELRGKYETGYSLGHGLTEWWLDGIIPRLPSWRQPAGPVWDEDDEDERHCRVCGCTDDNACDPPSHWVSDDLCSACDAKEELAKTAASADPEDLPFD
jgi:hypothetical protein